MAIAAKFISSFSSSSSSCIERKANAMPPDPNLRRKKISSHKLLQQVMRGWKIVANDWVGVYNPFSPPPDLSITNRWTDGWTDGQMGIPMERHTGRWTYGQDGRTDVWNGQL